MLVITAVLKAVLKAWNSGIGIYNGEMVFNRFLGNSWSDLDDFFGTPPWIFNFDKMVKKSAPRKLCIMRIADFDLFGPKVLQFFWAHFFQSYTINIIFCEMWYQL